MKRFFLLWLTLLLSIASPGQTGLVDDLFRVAAKAAKRAPKGATALTDDLAQASLRSKGFSKLARAELGLSVDDMAKQYLNAYPGSEGKLRVYLALDDAENLFAYGVDESDNLIRVHDPALEQLDLASYELVIEEDVIAKKADKIMNWQEASDMLLPTISESGGGLPLKNVNGKMVARLNEKILVPANTDGINRMRQILDWRMNQHGVAYASLFDRKDLAAFESFKGIDQYRNLDDIISLRKLFKGKQKKTVAIIGHVEGKSFVIRTPAGEVKMSVPFKEIEALAEQSDASVMFLGCNTGGLSNSAGLAGSVNSRVLASQLKAAQKARDVGDFLQALGSDQNPFVVSDEFLISGEYLELQTIDIQVPENVGNVLSKVVISSSRSNPRIVSSASLEGNLSNRDSWYRYLWVVLFLFLSGGNKDSEDSEEELNTATTRRLRIAGGSLVLSAFLMNQLRIDAGTSVWFFILLTAGLVIWSRMPEETTIFKKILWSAFVISPIALAFANLVPGLYRPSIELSRDKSEVTISGEYGGKYSAYEIYEVDNDLEINENLGGLSFFGNYRGLFESKEYGVCRVFGAPGDEPFFYIKSDKSIPILIGVSDRYKLQAALKRGQ